MNSIEKKVVSGTFIVVAAAALALMMLLIFSIRTCVPGPGFQAHGGVIDLRGWNPLDRTGLTGEWEYFPDQILLPSDLKGVYEKSLLAVLPGVWKDRRTGSATYRLKILLPEKKRDLALELSTFSTAFSLFADGQSIAAGGRVSATGEHAIAAFSPTIVRLDCSGSEMELVLQVSNYHYRIGGPWRTVWIGDDNTLRSRAWIRSLFFMFLMGAIMTIGAYHLVLHYFRREEKQFLFFSMFCFFVAFRILVSGGYFLSQFFPSIDFSLLARIEFLSMIFCLAGFAFFVRSILPDDASSAMDWIAAVFAVMMSLFILITPVRIFSWSVYPIYAFFAILSLWSAAVFVRAIKRRRPGASALLVGGLILSATALNDILYASFIVRIGPLLPLGLFFFIFIQAIVLSHQFVCMFSTVRKMSEELTSLNRSIEGRVEERTYELKAAYDRIRDVSVRDALTGSYNRRYIHEQLPKDIERCIRNDLPLSIIVGDIDFFKNVNDMFGHLAGDKVLISFCGVIEGSLRKGLEWFGRFGGEEFIIVLPETTPAVASVIAERIRGRCMGLEIDFENRKLRFSSSFGVAGFAKASFSDGVTAETLFRTADTALYAAKRGGRNRVESCDLADCGEISANAGR